MVKHWFCLYVCHNHTQWSTYPLPQATNNNFYHGFKENPKKKWHLNSIKNATLTGAVCLPFVKFAHFFAFFFCVEIFHRKSKRKMTKFDLPIGTPADDTDSNNSSLLSHSSNSLSSTSNQSLSSRNSFGLVNIGLLHGPYSIERLYGSAATIPSPIHQEFGTLDAILVTRIFCWTFFFFWCGIH